MFYACQTFKPISEADPHRLTELEEARGQLLRILELEGQCIAVFSWGAISLPAEMTGKLQGLIGRKVGILRLAGWHVRVVE